MLARWVAGWGPSRCDGLRRVQRREPFVHQGVCKCFPSAKRGRALPPCGKTYLTHLPIDKHRWTR